MLLPAILWQWRRRRSGIPLKRLCLEGPMEDLTKVVHLQPAITAINLICWQALVKALPDFRPAFFAGHSLGEYSALCASGIVERRDCLSLVTRRGELMEREGAKHPGGMRAVLGLTVEEIDSLLEDFTGGNGCCRQSQHRQAGGCFGGYHRPGGLHRRLHSRKGAKVVPLNVSVANHSPLLAGAVDDFAAFMRDIDFNRPSVPDGLQCHGRSGG
jgi:[acyl-carrier-protein] S-malonyltransferase